MDLREQNDLAIIKKIEGVGTPLGKKYPIRNGLATLANSNIYIFLPVHEDEYFYYHKYKNKIYKIEKSICKDIIKPNVIKDENDLSSKMEKIIFPYMLHESNCNNSKVNIGKIKLIEEKEFTKNYPEAYSYLSDYRIILKNRDKGERKRIREMVCFRKITRIINRRNKVIISIYI